MQRDRLPVRQSGTAGQPAAGQPAAGEPEPAAAVAHPARGRSAATFMLSLMIETRKRYPLCHDDVINIPHVPKAGCPPPSLLRYFNC